MWPDRARLIALIAVAALFSLPGAAHAALGTNLVRDGGGDATAASATEDDQRVPPAWTATGRFSIRPYGAPGGFPSTAHAATFGGGANFFEGGNAATSTGTQTISVVADAAAIDRGGVRAELSARLGGFSTDDDDARVRATWINAGGSPIASFLIGPVTPAERGNTTELQQRSEFSMVPAGTRSIRVTIEMTRADGANNDGYADNVSLVLTDTTPPQPPFAIRPENIDRPRVSGDIRIRRTVGCLSGMWTFEPSFTYAWTIDGAPVPGATRQAFRIPANARGKKVACVVTARAVGGSTATAASAPAEVQGKAGCLPIAGKRTCLRRGRRCKPSLRQTYRAAGFECKRRGKGKRRRRVLVRAGAAARRQGAVVAYGSNGLPSFAGALQAFERSLADLPRVKRKRGVAGKAPDGTAALSWMSLYRSRLSAAQKRVVDRFTTPSGVRKAGTAPAIVAYRSLVPEATRRLAAHGIRLKHGVVVQPAPRGTTGDALATAYPAWLENKGPNCVITIMPAGEKLSGNAAEARDTIAHELTHCAQAEQVADIGQWSSRPQWVTEGGATWAGGRIALEWTGTLGPISQDWYREWLRNSSVDLFKRDYAGVGWYQLLEHQGADVWPLLLKTQKVGSLYGAADAYFAGMDAAVVPAQAWGPTLATKPALGDTWDLKIPGYPITRTNTRKTISNGTLFQRTVNQRAGTAAELNIRSDVVTVLPGGAVVGLWKPPGEPEEVLREGEYCAKPGGCECPDGNDLDIPEIKRGEAYIGLHGLGPGAVAVVGDSVETRCKEKKVAVGVNIYRATGEVDQVVGTIKSAACRRTAAGWTADARSTNKAWRLRAEIGDSFRGFGREYRLIYGAADPTFTLEGPGGTYSNVAVPGSPGGGAITFNESGRRVGFGFVPALTRDYSGSVGIAGFMTCRYPRRR